MTKHPRPHYLRIRLLGLCLLLAVLCACSSTSGASTASPPKGPTVAAPALPKANTLGAQDWPTYHHDMARTGYLAAMPDPQKLTQAWKVAVDGAVYAEPLVVNGQVLVATENNSLYSFDAQTGRVHWYTNVGKPVSRSTLPCGNIDPLGITGTPVYDPQTQLVFAVATIEGPAHILVGVELNTGKIRVRRNVDLPEMEPGVHQQRAALALYKNRIYIAYGGLAGDCGQYIGTVVASQTDGKGPLLSYRVPTGRMGGIWAPSGPAIDEAGHVFVAVGNGESTQGGWDHSDSVLRLSTDLRLEDGFAPRQWQQENKSDTDLGSMGPLLLPQNQLFIAGKSGQGYLLRSDKLGGIGGQASEKAVCPNGRAMGGAALVDQTIFVPCTDGVQQLKLGSGTQLSLGWKGSQFALSPVVGGHTLYSLDSAGTLYAVDTTNGKQRARISLEEVAHFATPSLSSGHIFVGTMHSVVAITIA